MIINEDAYQTLYKYIAVEEMLIDSWFIVDGKICFFNLPRVTRVALFEEGIGQVIAALQGASAAYDIFETAHAAISVRGKKPRESVYHLVLPPLEDARTMAAGARWERLASVLRGAPLGQIDNIFIDFTHELYVHTSQRSIVPRRVDSALRVHIFYGRDNDSGRTAQLYLDGPAWSILQSDNDFAVMLIYLLNQGLVHIHPIPTSDQHLQQLLHLRSLHAIAAEVSRMGGIRLRKDTYQDYNTCVLVLPDEGEVVLCGNEALASLNRAKFSRFIQAIERQLDQTAQQLVVPL